MFLRSLVFMIIEVFFWMIFSYLLVCISDSYVGYCVFKNEGRIEF